MPELTPTPATYRAFEQAYAHYNGELFGGALSDCLITLAARSKRTGGYFSANRFTALHEDAKTDEIALNPQMHEMVHLAQQHHGTPGRGRYHNREWGEMMKRIGLYPSHTGQPGGKETGESMSHYILPDGRFAQSTAALLAAGFGLHWGENARRSDEDRSLRRRYTCAGCNTKLWGKPGLDLKIICAPCSMWFREYGAPLDPEQPTHHLPCPAGNSVDCALRRHAQHRGREWRPSDACKGAMALLPQRLSRLAVTSWPRRWQSRCRSYCCWHSDRSKR